MSQRDFSENIFQDVKDFTNTFCTFQKAYPNENQHIFDQIFKQIMKAEKSDEQYIETDKGQEVIWIFEKNGLKVIKRVFHPSPTGEGPSGADFVLYKMTTSGVKVTAVQVKRNRNQQFFKFEERDLEQLEKLASWGSAYYLMVDETTKPPLYCFLTVNEIFGLVGRSNKKRSVEIPNAEIRNYCRGINQFYGLFYKCIRGSKYTPENYGIQIIDYIMETKRAVVEISTRKKGKQKRRKPEKETHIPDFTTTQGRIKGLIDSMSKE